MLHEVRERRDKLQQGVSGSAVGGGSNNSGSRSGLVAGLMSQPQVPLRVNFFLNGSTSGKRCVLDRAQSLDANLPMVARRLGVFDLSTPLVYTSSGKLVHPSTCTLHVPSFSG
jgi:hypothetical protein